MSKTQGEGWGSRLALFQTEGYISPPPHRYEQIMDMTQRMQTRRLPQPLFCAQQEFLRHLARLAGVNAVTVWAVGKNRYQLSVLTQGKTQE